MLKVFLVEDEFVVREGIKNNVNWSSHGYEFCGEASDGELALPMIQKVQPDILITDIKMPFMDGLTLSKLVKEQFPWIEIIILSGYADFEYAKEGIKLGVAEYLTKPINGEELLKEVDQLSEKIIRKKKEREIQEKYKAEMSENLLQEKKNLFQSLVSGEESVPELLEAARRLNIDLSAIWYNIVLVKIKSSRHEQEEYSNSVVEIERRLETLEKEDNLLIFERNLEGKAFFFRADSQEELLALQEKELTKVKDIFATYQHIIYFGGIGQPVNRLREIPLSYEHAEHAFAHRFLSKESQFFDSSDLQENSETQNEAFNIREVDIKQLEKERVKEFLKVGDVEEVRYFIDEFFKSIGTGAMDSNLFRQYIAMDVYFCTVEFVEGIQGDRDAIEPLDIAKGTTNTVQTTQEYMERIISKALQIRDHAAGDRYGHIVEEVCNYIEEHFAEEELSLNLLASHVNFSPNHLSMVFGQQTGQTFIKYLTDYRMNKAKELLRCTGKRSSEISLEVGYKDPHYFSYLFKKTQGMTPTQYRGGHGVEGEE